jgi:autotransporter-associated beta strand protein
MHCRLVPSCRVPFLLAIAAASALLSSRSVFAEDFDWRNVNGQNWVTSVKDQGGAGTCWDFAGCGILEAKYMLTRNDTTYQPDVSEQQLCCAGVGSISGGNACNVDDYAVSTGIVLESELSYTQQNSSSQWPLASGSQNRVFKATSDNITIAQGANINTVKNCLKTYGPLTIHCVVPGDWYNLQDGSGSGNHEVIIVGFHDDANVAGGGYWIVKNSWGSGWNGDGNGNGYGEIAYASQPDYYDPPWYYFGLDDNHNVTGLNGLVYFTGAMATVAWNGGSGVWTLGGSSWSGVDMYNNSLSSYAWNNSEAAATFNASSQTNVTISGPVVAHGVTISSGATGYVFNGANSGAMTVTSSGITAHESVTFNVPVSIGAPQTWTTDSGKTLTIGGDMHTIVSAVTITGSGDTTITGNIDGGGVLNSMGVAPGVITKSGTGTLRLTGAATYSVPLTFSGGYLSFEQSGSNVANYTGSISGSSGSWVSKSGTGTIILSGSNSYSCWTRLYEGVVQADVGVGLPTQSSLILNGGVFQSNSTTTYTDKFRNETSGTNRWLSWWDGGFAGGGGKLTVNLRGDGSAITWTGNGDTGISGTMILNSTTANYEVEIKNSIALNNAERTIYVADNPNSANDYAVISGNLTSASYRDGSGINKTGPGLLILTGTGNSYGDFYGDKGRTIISDGALEAANGIVPGDSCIQLDGGVFQSNGLFNRGWYDNLYNNNVTWNSGGFAARGGKLTVNFFEDGRTISWTGNGHNGIAGAMILSSASADSEVEMVNNFDLNGGARTIQVNDNTFSAGDFATISGAIADGAGTGSVVKTGTGTLVLSGNNSFSGGMTVGSGTVILRNQTNASFLSGNIVNNAVVEFNTATADTTYTGSMSGSGSLNKTGAGRLILTGYNTFGDSTGYSGYTTINEGVVQADRGIGLSPNSGLVLNGGILQSNSAVTFTDPLWYWAPDGREVIWNDGGFAAGGGKMTVNLFGDGRTLNWGTDGTQGIAGTMKLSSSTAQFETEFQNRINLNGETRTIQVDDNPNSTGDFATISGYIGNTTGTAGITKTGSGMLVISGTVSNSYNGDTNVVQGILALGKTSGVAIPHDLNLSAPYGSTETRLLGNNQFATSTVINFLGGYWPHLELLSHTTTVGGISDIYGTGVIENTQDQAGTAATLRIYNTANYTYSGFIRDTSGGSGTLAIIKGNAGTLTLTGANCGGYTGGLSVNAGVLDYSGGVLPVCKYMMLGGMLKIGSLSQSIPGFQMYGGTVTGTGTLTSTLAYDFRAGVISVGLGGNADLNKSTAGTISLNTSAPSGNYLVSGGVLNLNGLSPSISGLQLTGGTVSGSGTLSSSSAYDLQSGVVGVALGGNVGLNKSTSGTVSLNTSLPSGSYVVSGGALRLNGLSQSISGLQLTGGTISGTGTLTSSSAYDLQSGEIGVALGGNVGLNKSTSGTVSLDTSLPSGSYVVSDGALNLNGLSQSISGLQLTGGAITGTGTLTSSSTYDLRAGAVSPSLSGAVGVSKSTNGTVTLNNPTYTGTTSLNAGALAFTGSLPHGNYTLSAGTLSLGALSGTIGTLNMLSGLMDGTGTLTSSSAYAIRGGTVTAILGGSVGLTKTSVGIATVNSPVYTGTTSVKAGSLTITGALPGGAYAISGGTLNTGALSRSIGAFQLTGGTVTGTGTLTSNTAYDIQTGMVSAALGGTSISLNKTTTGTAFLSGANTYTGVTTVTAGTLELGLAAESTVLSRGGADIRGGKMIFDYTGTSTLGATINAMLNTSFDGGLWDVGQFKSSTAATTGLTLGCVDNGTNQVTVMATYAGDFNLDGVVNLADLDVWKSYVGSGTTWQTGDANHDGRVNLGDLDLWTANCGCAVSTAVGDAGSVAIPEPGTLAILAMSLLGLAACAVRTKK